MSLRRIGARPLRKNLLTAPDEIKDLIRGIVAAESTRGLDPQAECLRVVTASARFAGSSYRITRELVAGLIDCSTLVSQAHWEGAAVATPFVAETQRIAYNAWDVADGDWLPADILVRYPSREVSPGGRHNHVAIFIGSDSQGERWIIESRAPHGVRALPVDLGAADGGVRRFLPNPTRVFPEDVTALLLAQAVPKLGRLGSRLTAPLTDSDRHRGIDIYLRDDVDVVAPISGSVFYSRAGIRGEVQTVTIKSEGRDEVVVMRPVRHPVSESRSVTAGAVIGRAEARLPLGCNAIPALAGFPRLHIEYWTRREMQYFPDRGLAPSWCAPGDTSSEYRAYNPLYALKLGVIASPIEPASVSAAALSPLPAAACREERDL